MEILQEQYDKETLAALINQGKAKPFNLIKGPTAEIVNLLNAVYAGRIDIDCREIINKMPVRIQILIDSADYIPWKWTFSFNLSEAERNNRTLDTAKIDELAEKHSLPDNKIGVTGCSHPFWTRGERLLQISALNLPPANIVNLFNAIFSDSITTT